MSGGQGRCRFCTPRIWNQGKAGWRVLNEGLNFAPPVFGIKAKPASLWPMCRELDFAPPVFGIKAKLHRALHRSADICPPRIWNQGKAC